MTELLEFVSEFSSQRTGVGGRVVRHSAILDVSPDLLIGIEFGRIARKLLGSDFGVLCKIRPHGQGAVVRVAAVPDDGDRTGQVSPKLPEKFDPVWSADVGVVGKHLEVEVAHSSLGAERDGTDDRDSVASIPALAGWASGRVERECGARAA